ATANPGLEIDLSQFYGRFCVGGSLSAKFNTFPSAVALRPKAGRHDGLPLQVNDLTKWLQIG
ncbi:MAG TPA: hypothetical protein VGB67_11440, partial [Fibrella sp.]